uniref:Uncharacterized protein n=1 Tax=Anguilla anguilla TaxID=7936 RepID=A0A0E9XSI5_ANGAN
MSEIAIRNMINNVPYSENYYIFDKLKLAFSLMFYIARKGVSSRKKMSWFLINESVFG